MAIEVKASRRVTRADVRGLVALNEDVPLRQRLVVSMEAHERTTDEGVRILPVTAFLSALWQDQLVEQSGAA